MKAETDPLHAALTRYRTAFDELPPLVAWDGTDATLVELLDAAIHDGRRLDEGGLARAMGVRPPPPGALI